jgi:hypothetical protein
MLRAPITASKLAVVRHAAAAEQLGGEFPQARVRHVPLGVDPQEAPALQRNAYFRCAVYGSGARAVTERATARIAPGRPVEILDEVELAALPRADAVVATTWPPGGESLMPALAGMAAGRPVIVFETEFTADWPTIDPQNWRSRTGGAAPPPIAIAIDPRDEEHSLMLAHTRLESDVTVARDLAAAGREWAMRHATLDASITAWTRAIDEAAALPPPQLPVDWPAHLRADGLDQARAILGELGLTVDVIQPK